MEIDLAFFAQRIATLAILGGFVGGVLAILAHGAVVAISDRLRARSRTLHRIAQLRMRQHAQLRGMPRG